MRPNTDAACGSRGHVLAAMGRPLADYRGKRWCTCRARFDNGSRAAPSTRRGLNGPARRLGSEHESRWRRASDAAPVSTDGARWGQASPAPSSTNGGADAGTPPGSTEPAYQLSRKAMSLAPGSGADATRGIPIQIAAIAGRFQRASTRWLGYSVSRRTERIRGCRSTGLCPKPRIILLSMGSSTTSAASLTESHLTSRCAFSGHCLL